MTWTDANIYCEQNTPKSFLAIVADNETNEQIKNLISSEAWIGLSRPQAWYWSDSGSSDRLMNWQLGQPDNLEGNERCAAVVVGDGTWTDEQCNATYPFFCRGSMNHSTISP